MSPRPRRDTLLGAIIGPPLGLGVVALLELLDSKVRNYDEMEELLGAPLLSVVPKGAFGPGAESGVVREAFQTLRASLTYFNVDSDVTSVVVTSAVKEEGKTTVAVNLALAAARSGRRTRS